MIEGERERERQKSDKTRGKAMAELGGEQSTVSLAVGNDKMEQLCMKAMTLSVPSPLLLICEKANKLYNLGRQHPHWSTHARTYTRAQKDTFSLAQCTHTFAHKYTHANIHVRPVMPANPRSYK